MDWYDNPRGIALTEAQIADFVARAERGESQVSIAADLGVHPQTLTALRRRLGLPPKQRARKRRPPPPSEVMEEIARRMQAGESDYALSREFGIHVQKLAEYRRQVGVRPLPRGAPKRPMTRGQRRSIEERLRQGVSAAQVAQETGFPVYRITAIRRDIGIVGFARKLTDEQEAELVARYVQGETGVSLAEEYGISRQRVPQLLAKYGVGPKRRLDEEEILAAAIEYEEGATITELASKYGVSAATIGNILRKLDVKRRKPGRRKKKRTGNPSKRDRRRLLSRILRSI